MMKSVAALFGALALTITAASAEEEDVSSANYMLPHCRRYAEHKPANLLFEGVCAGTLAGIGFMGGSLRDFSPLGNDVRRALCINTPPTATSNQLLKIVIAYIEARPARMHEPFTQLALEALRTAWPCR
jgi:Ssp1 endopeptidase immunity protein Rap1a